MKGIILLVGSLFAIGYLTKRVQSQTPEDAIRQNICGARAGCYDKNGVCWSLLFDGTYQGELIALPGEILPTSPVLNLPRGSNPCAPHTQFKI